MEVNKDSAEIKRANWFRYSVIALDVVPDALREIVKPKWKGKYGKEWQNDGTEGKAFINGGTLLPCDTSMGGGFTAERGQNVVQTSGDVTGYLKDGDCIRFVINGDDFVTVVCGDPKPPSSYVNSKTNTSHPIQGKIILRDPLPTKLEAAVVGFYSTNRLPQAERADGRNIDLHVRKKIETGKLAEMDTTALNFMLIGEKNHALMARPARNFGVLEQELKSSNSVLSESEWVTCVVGLRNKAMAHRTSAMMPTAEYEESCAAIKRFLESFSFSGLVGDFEAARTNVDFGQLEELKKQLERRWQEQFERMEKANEEGHAATQAKLDTQNQSAVKQADVNQHELKSGLMVISHQVEKLHDSQEIQQREEKRTKLKELEDEFRSIAYSKMSMDEAAIEQALAAASTSDRDLLGKIANLRQQLEPVENTKLKDAKLSQGLQKIKLAQGGGSGGACGDMDSDAEEEDDDMEDAPKGSVDAQSDEHYTEAKAKIQKASQNGVPYAERRSLYTESILAFKAALSGGPSKERQQRAAKLLSYAYYGAAFCFFRLRHYADAQLGFEDALAGPGLSDQTADSACKFHVYCIYAIGKEAIREGRYMDAQENFAIALNTQHRTWLDAWNAGSNKDYIKLAEGHAKECTAALSLAQQQITEETEVVVWAEANLIVPAGSSRRSFHELMLQNKLHKSVITKLVEEGYDALSDIAEADISELVNDFGLKKQKAKKLIQRAQESVVQESLARLGVTTLQNLLKIDAEKLLHVRDIFEETCHRGMLFDECFEQIKAALSNHKDCSETLTARLIGTLSLVGQTKTLTTSSAKNAYTLNLFNGATRTRTVRGNPLVQAKFNKNITELEAGSKEEASFIESALSLVATWAESASDYLHVTNLSPGSTIAHIEFVNDPSAPCSAEEAVAKYLARVAAIATQQDPNAAALGFMPKETLQLLHETGVVEAFAAPSSMMTALLNRALEEAFSVSPEEGVGVEQYGEIYERTLATHQMELKNLLKKCEEERLAIRTARRLESLTAGTAAATETAGTIGPETRALQPLAAQVAGDLVEVTDAEKQELTWTMGKPFATAPWVLYPGAVKLFRSEKLDTYIEEALKHKVEGVGMGMTQKELFAEIRKGCPEIGICICGGFLRDALQGKPGNDMDLTFITGKAGITQMYELGQEKGWTCKVKPDKGNYIHFGGEEKRDVEGKMMHNSNVGALVEGQWGVSDDLMCNGLVYSLELKVRSCGDEK
jgi:hypothetical protein